MLCASRLFPSRRIFTFAADQLHCSPVPLCHYCTTFLAQAPCRRNASVALGWEAASPGALTPAPRLPNGVQRRCLLGTLNAEHHISRVYSPLTAFDITSTQTPYDCAWPPNKLQDMMQVNLKARNANYVEVRVHHLWIDRPFCLTSAPTRQQGVAAPSACRWYSTSNHTRNTCRGRLKR